ncbi:bifunctional adenosylcobinamide kinase/adenosylcobinamide-phosphate guanylyltransferase [Paenibacillus sp. P96]|uniref:Bifunctional adenosylcobinamide kinase/adenosylcobinamide-phosphate guanylyltransferase n=1 Tax=Paenibacillus zeirhizosphaerae TaxID=2987519 RepID=A0ABT9FLA8_9BACL|nr:bifunctional adenosylcobinamide kinase/adenosylcobinamide-phosphate guanylyltransferase [Paenibacillus sp. P96]MDP4095503.1 bifunctional adenosylcobinamide kinase/adenosylcobinamide-phosphate guanylyltransferase [Paenibacillus sp. P96]
MLIMVTGGLGTGKTRFALSMAARLAREGIYISSPGRTAAVGIPAEGLVLPSSYHRISTDREMPLPNVLEHLNMESNIFRADRRMVIVDSVTGWIGSEFGTGPLEPADRRRLEVKAERLSDKLLSYQGMLLVITNELSPMLYPSEEEALFARLVTRLNMEIAERADRVYHLISGLPVELKERSFRY